MNDDSHPVLDAGATAPSRRTFLKAIGAGAVATVAGPTILGAQDKAGGKRAVIGEGEHRYECHHGWGELPKHVVWGDTHGVTVDKAGLIYVKHRAKSAEPMDSIVVFDPAGKFVSSFGKEYHGGGHGIDVRNEGGTEYLYLCDVKNGVVAKTSLTGEVVWSKKGPPPEPDVYKPESKYSPTNVAFNPDGGFYIADGYGFHYIHQYDKDAKWIRTWGGKGTETGKFSTPHGLWLDNRPGREPSLVVADRANARLQYFTLDGQPKSMLGDVSFPAHFDVREKELLVPDLHARVSIFDIDNKLVAHLGYDPEWTKKVLDGMKMRGEPKTWEEGRFVHPHDACYDADGNIFVVEWVPTGRVTKLRKVS